MAKKERDGVRERFWREALQRREKSGLTVVAFCEREGLKASTYHFWRAEIRRRDEQRQTQNNLPASRLAPVLLIKDQQDDRSTGIEIVARNGYLVRIGERATAEHVRRVLQAVSELD